MRTPWDWLRRRRVRESEWRDELDTHIAMRTERNQAEGLPPGDAGRAIASPAEARSVMGLAAA